jgi:hypothetical protein
MESSDDAVRETATLSLLLSSREAAVPYATLNRGDPAIVPLSHVAPLSREACCPRRRRTSPNAVYSRGTPTVPMVRGPVGDVVSPSPRNVVR